VLPRTREFGGGSGSDAGVFGGGDEGVRGEAVV